MGVLRLCVGCDGRGHHVPDRNAPGSQRQYPKLDIMCETCGGSGLNVSAAEALAAELAERATIY